MGMVAGYEIDRVGDRNFLRRNQQHKLAFTPGQFHLGQVQGAGERIGVGVNTEALAPEIENIADASGNNII